MIQGKRSDSPEPSCVSMKSNQSMDIPLQFREGVYPTELSLMQGKRSDSPEPSCVSMKSDKSMDPKRQVREGVCPTEPQLEHKVISLVKKELKRFKKLLSPDYPACSERDVEDEEDQSSAREGGAEDHTAHFQNNENLWDVTELTSVDVLLTNLIKGNLLPSALLWITSRPAAANQIPHECVDQVTEVRGFSDPQKEEYFRKRIRDQSLANRIIKHMKSSRSLYIMCHIPVFCWIAATVLEKMLGEAESGEIPKTLTQMFAHFLIFQIKHKDRKYHGNIDTDPQQTKKTILELGKLAFQQLGKKGNLIFYEEDWTRPYRVRMDTWTFFPRFLLGLSLESNQTLLQGLLTQTENSSHNKEETASYIKEKIRKNPSPEKSLNLFHCLNELKDQFSKEELDEFDLSKYDPSEECLLRLLPVVTASRKAVPKIYSCGVYNCSITDKGCAALASALRSNPSSHLRELNLNHNKPGDSGVKQLSTLLEDPHCKLEKLELYNCSITDEGCAALASALRSNPSSHLRELNLNSNKPGDSGVKQLSALLEDPHCKLEKLQLYNCSISEGCAALASALRSNPSSHLRELNLNCNKPGDSGVKQFSALLEDPHCKLEKLHLSDCSIKDKGCAALASALRSNHSSHLRELNLNLNKPGDSGVKQLSALLEDPHCKLEKLQLYNCNITDKGCAALASALRSNPSSHLRELNLNLNEPGDSGVKQLSALLEDPHCKLEKLHLFNCSITDEGCAALASALRSNPSTHLRELNLNHNKPGDSGVKQLSALLEDPHCKLEKLQNDLTESQITGLLSEAAGALYHMAGTGNPYTGNILIYVYDHNLLQVISSYDHNLTQVIPSYDHNLTQVISSYMCMITTLHSIQCTACGTKTVRGEYATTSLEASIAFSAAAIALRQAGSPRATLSNFTEK
ncbi:hypothetical protein P4O66_021093 [Electrophorus voltai]|uniref:NACHT, LRR and PYD domains-containing protein 12-like n=1 Tax=Electrophorus voltai TaxID=2609070 RepID=A0AAD8ZUG7_9TELE|nr:hypothetical protein P4O66_021093 [Electrophorus voltai]